jgi:hypothetical protein
MTDLSPYELRVLRHMHADLGFRPTSDGRARDAAMEALTSRGFVGKTNSFPGGFAYYITEAGRALVRARDAELTEAKNG